MRQSSVAMEVFIRNVLAGSTIEEALEIADTGGATPVIPPKVRGMEWIIAGDPLNIDDFQVDIFNIPSPTCIKKRLPPDRAPTRDELKEAWRACTSR